MDIRGESDGGIVGYGCIWNTDHKPVRSNGLWHFVLYMRESIWKKIKNWLMLSQLAFKLIVELADC